MPLHPFSGLPAVVLTSTPLLGYQPLTPMSGRFTPPSVEDGHLPEGQSEGFQRDMGNGDAVTLGLTLATGSLGDGFLLLYIPQYLLQVHVELRLNTPRASIPITCDAHRATILISHAVTQSPHCESPQTDDKSKYEKATPALARGFG
eukprot:CAMPEP_0118658064 /NCGR_PEP_ID=MMETSP0785-20121206/14362_1 /TAXON_ID=91992 /ORGANISM="Bolidomonas pacifica, Strain CCMP 1866" /LENGTH=146 /DNA_ID=CAMNT_0006551043 /DNA_START=22 /DNA_END=461 /DNA_ORIENTATION=-